VLLADTVKYPGVVANYLIIDAKVYFAITITLLALTSFRSKLANNIIKLNNIILVPLFLIYLVLILLEGSHFTNYVLNVFRLHLDGLVVVVLFSISIFLTNKFKDEIPKSVSSAKLLYYVIVFLLTLFLVKNASYVFDMAFNRNSYILFHLRNSYDQKMTYEWGKFYQFMIFVKNNTPENATIITPPMEDPWRMGSGNPNFVRAFLFPRRIIQESKIISEKNITSFGPNTYILITWGKEACKPDPDCHGWPRQDIYAKQIIYKMDNNEDVAEIKNNTIYQIHKSPYVYGIIKI